MPNAEIQAITQLPAALVFGVKVRPVGMAKRDYAATVARTVAGVLIAAVGINQAAMPPVLVLVGQGERVCPMV